jgi:hypothetical protein
MSIFCLSLYPHPTWTLPQAAFSITILLPINYSLVPYIQRLEGTSTETGEQVGMECPSVYAEVSSYTFAIKATLLLAVLL